MMYHSPLRSSLMETPSGQCPAQADLPIASPDNELQSRAIPPPPARGLQLDVRTAVATIPRPSTGYVSTLLGILRKTPPTYARHVRTARAVRPTRAPGRAGFTLLEVVIALVMAALIYAIALPAIARTRVSASVHNSRFVVESSVSLARATAMRYGRPAVLRFDSVRDQLWVVVDTSMVGSAALDTLGYFDIRAEFNVDLESNRQALCFNGRGIGTTGAVCPQAGAVITLALSGRADTVLVTPLGRVVQ